MENRYDEVTEFVLVSVADLKQTKTALGVLKRTIKDLGFIIATLEDKLEAMLPEQRHWAINPKTGAREAKL